MNLQQTTIDLDRSLRRQLRRASTLRQWAAQHPVLDPEIDTLIANMRNLDRDISHPVLACLVDLAKRGDQHAAQLVTVGLLQKFADKQRDRGETWDEFPGHLYEAIVTCHSTTSRCLREVIERNALRRNLKSRTLGTNDVSLDQADRLPSGDAGPETMALRLITRCEVFEVVEHLVREKRVTDANLRVLRHIATGSDPATVPELAGRCPSTAQARRRRAAQLLRDPRTRTALLTAVG